MTDHVTTISRTNSGCIRGIIHDLSRNCSSIHADSAIHIRILTTTYTRSLISTCCSYGTAKNINISATFRIVSSETGTNYADNALSTDQAGLVRLNGVQAAAYCRIRPAEGGYDAGRTERTRDVIAKVLGKAFQLSTSDMLQFANVFYDKMTTDIPDEVFLTLAENASELRQYSQISDRIPIDEAYESGDTGSGYYVVPDFNINNRHLRDSIYKGIHE